MIDAMEIDESLTGQALLAALRQHADPRQWLKCHAVADVISIAEALCITGDDAQPDALIDRILLAEWNRGAS